MLATHVPSSPAELGLDPKRFPAWRKFQKQAIEATMDTDKPYVLVEAPTGMGKSLFAMALAELHPGRTHYLVTTKTLQEQVKRDFPHVFSIWGKNMYHCALEGHEKRTVDKAICNLGYKCPIQHSECQYYLQKLQSVDARVLITNYQWYWYNLRYSDLAAAEPPSLLICDEADTIEPGIMSFSSIIIESWEYLTLGMSAPKAETFTKWLGDAEHAVKIRRAGLMEKHFRAFKSVNLVAHDDDSIELLQGVRQYDDLLDRVKRMQNGWKLHAHLYVTDFNSDYVAIRPIVATIDSPSLIHERAPKKVFMSGTLLGKKGFCTELGINPDHAEYISVESTFPAEQRPLVLHNIASLNKKNLGNWLDPITEWVDGLIDAYEGQKGIIHTTSYQIAQHILRASHNRDILLGHGSDNRSIAIKHFKHRSGNAVIVSPSLVRGEDFPGFHCRWQAIVKAPFPNIGDPQVRARMNMEKSWLDRVTLRNVIQAYGRGMRSEDDYCDTHVFDGNVGNLFDRNRSLVPDYVWAAVSNK